MADGLRGPRASSATDTLSAGVFGQLVARAKKQARPMYGLHVGDTYLEPIEAARAEAQLTSACARLHNYAPVQGEPVLLEAAARYLERRYGAVVPPSDLQVTSGATAGLSIAATAMLEPGDEVILPAPYWPLIRGIIAARGAIPVEVPLWHQIAAAGADATRVAQVGEAAAAAIAARITPKTRAIYVNSPHNPTGAVMPASLVDEIAKLAVEHDCWVICDEAYEEIDFRDDRPTPMWKRPDLERYAVAFHTMSKGYGLAGSRVGFVHGAPAALEAIRKLSVYHSYCAPRPLQRGAARALDEGDEWVRAARRTYRGASRLVAERLAIPAPAGGTFVLIDPYEGNEERRPTGADEAEASLRLLERCVDQGVLLTPGGACGAAFTSWVRLCFSSLPEEDLAKALDLVRPILRPELS